MFFLILSTLATGYILPCSYLSYSLVSMISNTLKGLTSPINYLSSMVTISTSQGDISWHTGTILLVHAFFASFLFVLVSLHLFLLHSRGSSRPIILDPSYLDFFDPLFEY